MIPPAQIRSFEGEMKEWGEKAASLSGASGTALFLFSPFAPGVEFLFRGGLSLELCGALTVEPAMDLLARARRTAEAHLFRPVGLAEQVPELGRVVAGEGMERLALFPLLGEESVLGYMVVGLAQGAVCSTPGGGLAVAWGEMNRALREMRGEVGRSVLRKLLSLYEQGLGRDVQALAVVDSSERVLLAHGMSRVIPQWGRGELMGQQLRNLPGGRVFSSLEVAGSGHMAWRTRKVSMEETEQYLDLSLLTLGGRVEERSPWRVVLVRGGEGSGSGGATLMEMALRLLEGEGRGEEAMGSGSLDVARQALSVAEELQAEEGIDLTGIFRGFLGRVEEELRGDRIRVLPFLQAELPLVRGNRRLMETALWALLRKAWTSLLPGGGTITLRTWEEEGSVWITVAEDGSGREGGAEPDSPSMESPALGGEEDALPESGIALARRLIGAGGGTFSVEVRSGLWTRYTVVFPAERTVSRRDRLPAGLPPAVEVRRTPPGGLQVLVVDDNDMVRTVLRRYLEKKGHGVTEAMDGGVALDILQEKAFDRVMVDIDMPGTTGVEFYRLLDEVNPEMRERTVFMTGGFQEGETEDFIVATGRPHIQKPFDLGEIGQILQA